jgi:hypothetical protein
MDLTPGDSLFRDDRHLRGDLRRVRAAIRKGWLDSVSQEHRDALVKAFVDRVDPEAIGEMVSESDRPSNGGFRRLMAATWLIIEIERASQREAAENASSA